MRHRGEDVGHFFLAEKADGEASTDDDQEVLTLFASQAAAAITNARTHRRPSSRHGNLRQCSDAPTCWAPGTVLPSTRRRASRLMSLSLTSR